MSAVALLYSNNVLAVFEEHPHVSPMISSSNLVFVGQFTSQKEILTAKWIPEFNYLMVLYQSGHIGLVATAEVLSIASNVKSSDKLLKIFNKRRAIFVYREFCCFRIEEAASINDIFVVHQESLEDNSRQRIVVGTIS